jgi:hypothetical protein
LSLIDRFSLFVIGVYTFIITSIFWFLSYEVKANSEYQYKCEVVEIARQNDQLWDFGLAGTEGLTAIELKGNYSFVQVHDNVFINYHFEKGVRVNDSLEEVKSNG